MLIYDIFDAVKEKPTRGFPMLIGPTQWGKTHAGYAYARERKLPFVPINPQLETEEEFGGFPIKDETARRKGGNIEVEYSMPPALTTMFRSLKINLADPFVLFIDEMDKARNDVLSCLLTLTSPMERRLRHIKLHSDVLLLGAMNEPQRALPEPLLARMLMIPFPYDYGEYTQSLPMNARDSFKKLFKAPTIKFPARPQSPGSLFTLMEWYDFKPFWDNEHLQTMVVRGLFPEQMVPSVIEDLRTEKPISNPVEWVKRASPQAILKGLIKVLDQANPEGERDILQAFLDRAQADPTAEIGKLWESFASEKSPEPHACVKFNIELKKEAGVEFSGKTYYWTGEIGQQVWEREFKKAVKAK